MRTDEYAEPTLSVARRNLRTLFEAFGEATGYPPTLVGFAARGDRKWAREFENRDFRHGTYDIAVGRLSALWPEGAPWPADVPRLAPAEVPAEIRAELARRDRKRASVPAGMPAGAEWPEDIPFPGHTQTPTQTREGKDGQES